MNDHTNIIATLMSQKVDPLGRRIDDPAAIRAGIVGPVMDVTEELPAPTPVAVTGEIKTVLDEIKTVTATGLSDLRAKVDALEAKGVNAAADGEIKSQLEKIVADITALDEKGAKMARAVRANHAADAAVERVLDGLDRAGLAPASDEAKSAFWIATRYGAGNLDADQRKMLIATDRSLMPVDAKSMTVGNQATGGFLAPSEFVREIIKGIVEWSPIRELARVRQTSSKSSMHPVRTGLLTGATWENESSTLTEGTGPQYGMLEIPNHKLRAWVVISAEDLEDPVFDMEAELREGFMEDFAIAEGRGFAIGDGDKRPEGLWYNTDIDSVNSGAAAAITADALRRAYYGLKEPYARNATWLLRRATLLTVALFKDGEDNYLFSPGITGTAVPPTILGRPYREVVDAPAEGAGLYPVLFGDIRRTYTISDRVAMSVKRDEYSEGAALADNVNFFARKRVGGQVTDPNASIKIKCDAG